MKVAVNRQTGEMDGSPDASYASKSLTVYGHVDRLHTESGKIWRPSWDMLEGYLARQTPASLPKCITNIEGTFLIFYQAGGRTYIFCDRFCLFRAYYRVTPRSIELFDTILGNIEGLRVNPAEAAAFVLFRYVPGRRTLFDGINMIASGECLIDDPLWDDLQIEVQTVFPKIELQDLTYPEAGQTFQRLFRAHLEAQISRYPDNEPLLLPLSGGFDSRYVLAVALELAPASRIIASTFGQPGSYDYEIGQQVAKKAGVRHIPCPLTPADFSDEALARNAQDVDGQIGVAIETPLRAATCLAEYGRVVLSGHPGGAPLGLLASSEQALDARSVVLHDVLVPWDSPLAQYLDHAIVEESFIPLRYGGDSPLQPVERWILTNHAAKYSVPCVYKLRQHFDYISPFADYDFSDFTTNLPLEMRLDRKLYQYWLGHKYPALFALPCACYRGAPLTAGKYRKYAAKQWDRFLRRVLGINRLVNKIDLAKYSSQLLDQDKLYQFASRVFPAAFRDEVLKPACSYIMLQYNIKSLAILQSHWQVEFCRAQADFKDQKIMEALKPGAVGPVKPNKAGEVPETLKGVRAPVE